LSDYAPESGIDSFDAAALALSNAGQADTAEREGTSYTPPATEGTGTEEGTTTPPEQAAQPVETTDSFTKTDLNSLLEGVTDPNARAAIEAAYKGFQSDYTRGMQQIAPWRQLAETGVDPAVAAQSLEFVQALETDPDFVRVVHRQLSQALEAAGLSPAQASDEAARQIQSGEAFQEDNEGDLSPLQREVAELREWREQMETQQVQHTMMAELQRSEMAIRQANETYTDQDIERVYELAFAHGGDLHAAAKSYETLRQSFISGYVDQKGAASAGIPSAAVPVAAASSDEPVDMKDWNTARLAAREFLRNQIGQ
jgi:hypothetical protein